MASSSSGSRNNARSASASLQQNAGHHRSLLMMLDRYLFTLDGESGWTEFGRARWLYCSVFMRHALLCFPHLASLKCALCYISLPFPSDCLTQRGSPT
jgi:hypothetical protein